MSNVIRLPAHKMRAKVCEACNGVADKTLPTHCPGVKMTLVQQLSVKHGSADFVNGDWVYYKYIPVKGKRT